MNNVPSKIAQQLAIPSQASTSTRNTVTSMNHIPIYSRPVTMSARPTIPSILEPELRPEPPSEFSFNTTKNPIEKPPIKELNINTCVSILFTGKKLNSKYSYPSQFPNLTKGHSFTTTIKGGKKKKMNKKSEKNKNRLKVSNHIA